MSDVEAIAQRVMGMTPADRLRLAAELLERDRFDLALSLVRATKTELEVAALRRAAGGSGSKGTV